MMHPARIQTMRGEGFVASVRGWAQRATPRQRAVVAAVALLVLWLLVSPMANSSSSGGESASTPAQAQAQTTKMEQLYVATWNVGAINNNPFEYWLTIPDDPAYGDLLSKVESLIKDVPAKKDVLVSQIFTEQMYAKLKTEMAAMKWAGIDKVDKMWRDDWSKRKSISEFLKDPQIGLKRLVSMPDRVTNTIQSGSGDGSVWYRPTAINCYARKMGALPDWFEQWTEFMFRTPTRDGKTPAALLEPIPRAKYPEITEEEESVSVPLQTLVVAIFDAIQVRMLNQLTGQDAWQALRTRICTALNTKKVKHTLDILKRTYADVDVFFLQETSAAFLEEARAELRDTHHVLAPQPLGNNDQNSLVLLRKAYFPAGDRARPLSLPNTPDAALPPKLVSRGDLFMVEAQDAWGRPFVLASFHGDTNGLATIPVVKAVVATHKTFAGSKPAPRLVFGLDANTYFKPKKGVVQDVAGFQTFLDEAGLASCWGAERPPPETTRNARTYMQPQLSKAASSTEIATKGDVNPKDFVLFHPGAMSVGGGGGPVRDNTGERKYTHDMVFPTLTFPSDHAVLSVVLKVT